METDQEIFQNGQGVSQALADLLAREWKMPETRREKAVLVSDLICLFDAVQAIGWIEHTGDWDWRVHVRTTEGVRGTIYSEDESKERWADTIMLQVEGEEAGMGPNEVRENIWGDPPILYVMVEEFHIDDDTDTATWVPVNLDDVQSITYEEL